MNHQLLSNALPRDVLMAMPEKIVKEDDYQGAMDWLFNEGRFQPAVKKYIGMMKSWREQFILTAELFDHWTPADHFGTKKVLRLTNPSEIFNVAHHLYVLDSFNVPGDVLECGCAHGFSSTCLSIAAGSLGRKLIIADSFEGLPATSSNEKYFEHGDFAAREEEVREHISITGRIDSVKTIKGFYSASLKGWSHPLALLWMDVDLYGSAIDLLGHVAASLDRRGAIFTHEFTDVDGHPYPPGSQTVPGAIFSWFDTQQIPVHSYKTARFWGVIGAVEAVQLRSYEWCNILAAELDKMDRRSRLHHELLTSRTVATAFKLKNMFRIK